MADNSVFGALSPAPPEGISAEAEQVSEQVAGSQSFPRTETYCHSISDVLPFRKNRGGLRLEKSLAPIRVGHVTATAGFATPLQGAKLTEPVEYPRPVAEGDLGAAIERACAIQQ